MRVFNPSSKEWVKLADFSLQELLRQLAWLSRESTRRWGTCMYIGWIQLCHDISFKVRVVYPRFGFSLFPPRNFSFISPWIQKYWGTLYLEKLGTELSCDKTDTLWADPRFRKKKYNQGIRHRKGLIYKVNVKLLTQIKRAIINYIHSFKWWKEVVLERAMGVGGFSLKRLSTKEEMNYTNERRELEEKQYFYS